MTALDTLDCARWLASRGLYVFAVDHPSLPHCAGAHKPDAPCDGKRGKHPCGRWSRDSTTDPERVIRAFSGPARNIGIDCGKSGLLVADEDEPGALNRYAASVGEILEPTFTVPTSRGAHYYHTQPAGDPYGNSPGQLAAFHIDARGKGGFVVGPGSTHESGHVYRPADAAAAILPAPAWLLAALRPERPPGPATRAAPGVLSGRRPSKTLAGLLQVVLDATPDRDRNTRLFWASCRAFEHANAGLFSAHDAARALLEAAERVKLDPGEAKATITSAHRTPGSRTPR
jgi:hypothetical protein